MTSVYIAFGLFVALSLLCYGALWLLLVRSWRTIERQEIRHERQIAELTDQLMHAMGHTWRYPDQPFIGESLDVEQLIMDPGPEVEDVNG